MKVTGFAWKVSLAIEVAPRLNKVHKLLWHTDPAC